MEGHKGHQNYKAQLLPYMKSADIKAEMLFLHTVPVDPVGNIFPCLEKQVGKELPEQGCTSVANKA